jgi:hypothetical protein
MAILQNPSNIKFDLYRHNDLILSFKLAYFLDCFIFPYNNKKNWNIVVLKTLEICMPLYTMERKNLLNFEHFKNKKMMDSFGGHWHKKNFKIIHLNAINSKTIVEAILINKCDDDNLCKRQLLTTFTPIIFYTKL